MIFFSEGGDKISIFFVVYEWEASQSSRKPIIIEIETNISFFKPQKLGAKKLDRAKKTFLDCSVKVSFTRYFYCIVFFLNY